MHLRASAVDTIKAGTPAGEYSCGGSIMSPESSQAFRL